MTTDLSTRDRLIQAAISIIETEGEAGVRVDQVAALAGFTKPVLYAHFFVGYGPRCFSLDAVWCVDRSVCSPSAASTLFALVQHKQAAIEAVFV